MSRRFVFIVCFCATSVAAATARADNCTGVPPINGANLPSLPSTYSGGVSATQDNPTGFGDHAPPVQADTQGSELDALYLAHDASLLYFGVIGNTPRTDSEALRNTVLLLIDTSDIAASTVLATTNLVGGSGAIQFMNGVRLEGVFTPEWAVEYWNNLGTNGGGHHAVLFDLTNTNSTATTLTLNTDFAVDNTNLLGVNGNSGNDPILQASNAATAKKGFQFKLAKSLLSPTHLRVQALLANRSGSLSNQSLPPLRLTVGQSGGGVACLGIFDANSNIIRMEGFTGDQHVTFDLNTNVNTNRTVAFGAADIPAAFGDLSTNRAGAAAIQNNYTCFGDAAAYQPGLTPGSELDLLYVRNDANNLYVGIAGQIPVNDTNNDSILLFIQSPNTGACNRLYTASLPGGSGALQGLDLFQFDGTVVGVSFCNQTGFAPDFCVQYWRTGNSDNAILSDLVFSGVTPLSFSIDPAFHSSSGAAYVADVRNVLGVNDIPGDDPLTQEQKARTARKGVQFSLNLTSLGLTAFSQVKMMAMIASGTGYVSNQFLPPLNANNPPPLTSTDAFTNGHAIPDSGTFTDSHLAANAGTNGLTRVTGVTVTVNINHPAVQQLAIDLRYDPTGQVVHLAGTNSCIGGPMTNTAFAQGGAALSTWTAPGTGTFQPVGSLLNFNNVDPVGGTWSLIVSDTVAGQTGTLNSWTLDLKHDRGGAVGCLGSQAEALIDLNNFFGDQYATTNLTPTSAPVANTNGLYTADNIPAAFGDNSSNAAAALAVQNNYTCFQDAIDNSLAPNAGSELDELFITNSIDRLKVAVTGNLEGNGNAVIVLIDSNSSTGVPIDPGTGNAKIQGITSPPFALGGQGSERGLNGLILDPGFNPDYAVTMQRDTTAPADYFQVFLTNLVTNSSRAVGTAIRNSGNGLLGPAVPNGNGSEADLLYVTNDANNLYVGITGNVESNGNAYVFLIQTPASTNTSQLITSYTGVFSALSGVNLDHVDVGFLPNYAVVVNRTGSGGAFRGQLVDLNSNAATRTTTLVLIADGLANHFYGDNLNTFGVDADTSHTPEAAYQSAKAITATRGVQFTLARSALGVAAPGGDGAVLQVAAAVIGSTGFWSNQLLPPLGGDQLNVGDNADLSSNYAPGNQYAAYTLSATYQTPSSFNGSDIPAAFGDTSTNRAGAFAIQNNNTGFNDQALPPSSGNTNCIQVAFDDSNIVGVTGASAANAATASTGVYFDLPFADIGIPGVNPSGPNPTVKVMAVVTGGSGYLSNQFLPGLGRGNAGNLGNIGTNGLNLGDTSTNGYPGNQWLAWPLIYPRAAADINADSFVNTTDVTDFVRVLLGLDTNPVHVANSDFNSSGTADGRDIPFFVNAYIP